MEQLEVRIITLPPMRVICFNGFGPGPETQAIDKTRTWAEAHGLLGKPCRLFGYNNPDPTPGSPNYGYDFCMTVDEAIQADGEARIIDFPGGQYAVTRCQVKSPEEDIPATWQKLFKWKEASRYRYNSRLQWLEEHLVSLEDIAGDQAFSLDLYMPIE
jgi:DNA gyrase inhibitor GyrI